MLDEATIAAVHEALDDEYRARATYRAVIAAFGPVRPFVHIVGSEERHAAALEAVLERHGLPLPADRWAGRVEAPASLAAACAAGVEAEVENEAMYARLLAAITDPEVAAVMRRLQAASRDRHLPAFQRGLARGGRGGRGRGRRWRGGRG